MLLELKVMEFCDLGIMSGARGQFRLVFEERGRNHSSACPSHLYSDWGALANALHNLGIDEKRIAGTKILIESSSEHEAIIEDVCCTSGDMVSKAGFDPSEM